jgi:molybdate transport system substrate-binding protein
MIVRLPKRTDFGHYALQSKSRWLAGLDGLIRISLLTVLNVSAALSSFGAEITVAAASDLSPASAELRAGFERQSGHKVNWINGSSGLFARQVEAGAPFDVFLSADEKIVEDLVTTKKVLAGSPKIYARGRLGLWSKKAAEAKAGSLALSQLEAPDVRFIAIANPAHAPYGRAAKDFLERRGLWAKLLPKVVYAENVLQAFQFAASGNADFCLVAWSQVMDKGGLALDPAQYMPLRQTGAIPYRAEHPAEARAFLAYLSSKEGQAILGRHGFLTP